MKSMVSHLLTVSLIVTLTISSLAVETGRSVAPATPARKENEVRWQLNSESEALHLLLADLGSFSAGVREHALSMVPMAIVEAYASVEQVANVKNQIQFRDSATEIADLIGYELPLKIKKMGPKVFKTFMNQLFEVIERKTAEHFAENLTALQSYPTKNLDAEGMREWLANSAKRNPVIEFDLTVSRRLRFASSVMDKNEVRDEKWRRVALKSVALIAVAAGVYTIVNDWSAVWSGTSLLTGVLTFVGVKYPGLFQNGSRDNTLNEARGRAQNMCSVLLSSQSETQ